MHTGKSLRNGINSPTGHSVCHRHFSEIDLDQVLFRAIDEPGDQQYPQICSGSEIPGFTRISVAAAANFRIPVRGYSQATSGTTAVNLRLVRNRCEDAVSEGRQTRSQRRRAPGAHAFSSSATAIAANPSRRPVNPSFSVVVAFRLICSTVTFNSCATRSRMASR